jgi:phosphoribosylamine--glycine ligase
VRLFLGLEISNYKSTDDSIVFHSGTIVKDDKVLTNGGRVFAITSFGDSIKEAVAKSFVTAENISYDKKYYRSDIGKDLMLLVE